MYNISSDTIWIMTEKKLSEISDVVVSPKNLKTFFREQDIVTFQQLFYGISTSKFSYFDPILTKG